METTNETKTAFTPGEWHEYMRNDDGAIFIASGDQTIATVHVARGEYAEDGETEANARLVIAAPLLLEALEHVISIVDPSNGDRVCASCGRPSDPDPAEPFMHNDWCEARAAIARARGEAQ